MFWNKFFMKGIKVGGLVGLGFLHLACGAPDCSKFSLEQQKNLKKCVYKSLDRDGRLRQKGIKRFGKVSGKAKTLYENGKLKAVNEYVEGRLHGLSISYYPNGKVESRVQYKNGRPDGLNQTFF